MKYTRTEKNRKIRESSTSFRRRMGREERETKGRRNESGSGRGRRQPQADDSSPFPTTVADLSGGFITVVV